MSTKIVGILLAAGNSERFGDNKLLQILPHHNRSIVRQSAENLLQALPNSIAVINKNIRLTAQLTEAGIHTIENTHPELGLSSSIVTGIQGSMDAKGWVFALADMPFIPAGIISEIAKKIQNGAPIVFPTFNQQQGHPVGFSRQYIKELLALTGDAGAKSIIAKHLSVARTVQTSENGILRDIDTPEDIQKLTI